MRGVAATVKLSAPKLDGALHFCQTLLGESPDPDADLHLLLDDGGFALKLLGIVVPSIP